MIQGLLDPFVKGFFTSPAGVRELGVTDTPPSDLGDVDRKEVSQLDVCGTKEAELLSLEAELGAILTWPSRASLRRLYRRGGRGGLLYRQRYDLSYTVGTSVGLSLSRPGGVVSP